MKKSLKKMIATISAMAVCATSVISTSVGAIAVFKDREVRPETTSFSASMYGKDVKFHLWQKATDYFDDEDIKIYVSDTLENNKGEKYNYKLISSHEYRYSNIIEEWIDRCNVGLLNGFFFEFDNIEDLTSFTEYLKDNKIAYSKSSFGENTVYIDYTDYIDDEYFDTLQKIKDDTGIEATWWGNEASVQVTEAETPLPEPTLAGDANEDGKVSIADAVLIMQALSNPDEFQLTPQGIANADIYGDGDGITVMDALTIQ